MAFFIIRKGKMEQDLDKIFKSMPKQRPVTMRKIRKDKKKTVFDINF